MGYKSEEESSAGLYSGGTCTSDKKCRVNFLTALLALQERLAQSQSQTDQGAISRELDDIRRDAEESWEGLRRNALFPVRPAFRRLLLFVTEGPG